MKRVLLGSIIGLFSFFPAFSQDILNYTPPAPPAQITSDLTWDSYDVIYVNGAISIGTGGSLTIKTNINGQNAGANLPLKVIFMTSSSGITITGNGKLNVLGTIQRKVFFNADKNLNNNLDAGETWANIYFNGSTGESLIENSIIENGTGSVISHMYGGGLQIIGSNITVKNSIVRNCSASNGGGIFVRPNPLTTGIINLIGVSVYNNTASKGGGIYVYANVKINNCDVNSNRAPENGGAGLYFYSTGTITNSKIYNNAGEGIFSSASDIEGYVSNCIIRNNNKGVVLYGARNIVNCNIVNNSIIGIVSSCASPIPKIVNSVLWGNATQYIISSGAVLELGYCAIQGGINGGIDGGFNKNLSAVNADITGPNFQNNESDFHIKSWVSPLVDGGTITYQTLNIPTSDAEGKQVFESKDIGISEFIYYIWSGGASTTEWSNPANWLGSHSSIPSIIDENKVLIPSGLSIYPEVDDLTLLNRSCLIIEPLAALTVNNSTIVNPGCKFLVRSDIHGSADFITGTSITGNYTVELFLAGGGDPNFKWHYVTTPVDGASPSVLTTEIGNLYNLLSYDEKKARTNKNEGWNWYDGFEGSTPIINLRSDFGYNVYVDAPGKTAVFNGSILPGIDFPNAGISYSDVSEEISGWNLIGNPFTSSIDLNLINFGLDVESTVYFTKDNGYTSVNVYNNESVNDSEGKHLISPMQGFFVHVRPGWEQYVVIPALSRVHANSTLQKKAASIYGKGRSVVDYPKLKLNVSDESSFTDETLIYFFDDATIDFDIRYDGYKMFSKNPLRPQIYTTSSGKSLSLNALSLDEGIVTVPLKVKIGQTNSYSIHVLDLQNLSDYKITLVHGSNNIDLKSTTSYTFNAQPGTINDMSIVFENITTGLNDAIQFTDYKFQCWYRNETLYVKSLIKTFENNSTINLFDVTGNLIYIRDNLTLSSGQIIEIPINLKNGIYICKLANKNLVYSQKVVVVN